MLVRLPVVVSSEPTPVPSLQNGRILPGTVEPADGGRP